MSDEPKIGDRKLFGTYYSEYGPVLISLDEYVWVGDRWVHPRSPWGMEILEETKKVDE